MILNIEDTLSRLLAQEDTDGDKKITIEDLCRDEQESKK